ncbi:MAG: transcriptional repressor [Bacillota bacterium]|nr:transcriptional repressor [Bacillota bacterium]MDW7684145.1 transcriptional repressor [Bacillota bacterium]
MTQLPRIHRMTKQRQIILEVLRSTRSHPTADWIYEQVRQSVPRISLGTVYRNLRVLKDMGDIQELNYGSTYSRFDANSQPHYHFVCQGCGTVMDIDMPVLTEYDRQVADAVKGHVDFHRMEFYGTCPDCTDIRV